MDVVLFFEPELVMTTDGHEIGDRDDPWIAGGTCWTVEPFLLQGGNDFEEKTRFGGNCHVTWAGINPS